MQRHNADVISEIMHNHQIQRYGWANFDNSYAIEFYKSWIEQGLNGSMAYLERHLPQKEDPTKLLAKAQSAITVAYNYRPHPVPLENSSTQEQLKRLSVASYALGQDYHKWLKELLEQVALDLKNHFKDDHFLVATDSSPVLERDLAYRSGLGWVGKNTCLINAEEGSFFLLGEILTTLKAPEEVMLHPDRCGTCTRCIDQCPTKAIVEPLKLDARRCISYLTIESKEIPAEDLRQKIGVHFFGCDICQTVCPWNRKVVEPTVSTVLDQATPKIISDLRWILTASHKELENHFKDTALSRSRGFGLKRNALIVATNAKLKVLIPEISVLQADPRLGELAKWSLTQLMD